MLNVSSLTCSADAISVPSTSCHVTHGGAATHTVRFFGPGTKPASQSESGRDTKAATLTQTMTDGIGDRHTKDSHKDCWTPLTWATK